MQKKRIARVSTVPFFVFTQLRGQLEALADSGAEVNIVTSGDQFSEQLTLIQGCTCKLLPIAREIRPFSDLKTLIRLWWLFRKERYHIVHSTTPKAGLLCAIAGKLAGVPVRMHTFTGQTWTTMHGIKKKILQWSDKLVIHWNTCCYTDSFAQRDFLLTQNIAEVNRLQVLGSGSLAGVDIRRFTQENYPLTKKQEIKSSLGLDAKTKVLLFIGRITQEKGIFELLDALRLILEQGYNCTLLVVGYFDQRNEKEIRQRAEECAPGKVVFTGFQPKPEQFIAVSDILCLPSYREGFGTVVLEAAAMGIPTVGSDIYGLQDAIIHNETGLLVESKNSTLLAQSLMRLLADDKLRCRLGHQAQKRVLHQFDSQRCHELLIAEYERLLAATTKRIG